MGYIRLKLGNYVAVFGAEGKMIEVEAASLDEARQKARDYFLGKYRTLAPVIVFPVPARIGVL